MAHIVLPTLEHRMEAIGALAWAQGSARYRDDLIGELLLQLSEGPALICAIAAVNEAAFGYHHDLYENWADFQPVAATNDLTAVQIIASAIRLLAAPVDNGRLTLLEIMAPAMPV